MQLTFWGNPVERYGIENSTLREAKHTFRRIAEHVLVEAKGPRAEWALWAIGVLRELGSVPLVDWAEYVEEQISAVTSQWVTVRWEALLDEVVTGTLEGWVVQAKPVVGLETESKFETRDLAVQFVSDSVWAFYRKALHTLAWGERYAPVGHYRSDTSRVEVIVGGQVFTFASVTKIQLLDDYSRELRNSVLDGSLKPTEILHAVSEALEDIAFRTEGENDIVRLYIQMRYYLESTPDATVDDWANEYIREALILDEDGRVSYKPHGEVFRFFPLPTILFDPGTSESAISFVIEEHLLLTTIEAISFQ